MDDEYIQIEMTRKEWEQWTSNIATNAVKVAFGHGTLAPTTPSASYRVTIEPPSCECEDFVLPQAQRI